MKKKSLVAVSLATILTLTGCFGGNAIPGGKGDDDNQNANIIVKDNTDPVIDVVETPVEEDKEVAWKEIYDDYLKNGITEVIGDYDEYWRDEWTFGFMYLNDDDVPELVACSGYEAAGNIILTIIDDKVEHMNTARLSFYYKEKGNCLINSEGHMGYYYDTVFKITDKGFECVCEGEYEDEYDENGPTGNTKYKLDTREVTESEYRAEIDAYISYKDRVYWERGCSYTAMLNYLEGKGPKDYKEAYTQIINAHSSEAGTKFSLIEVTDRDPLLLIVDDKKMSLCSYEDGLVNEGPDNYFSDGQIILMYPSIGVIMNQNSYTEYECYTAYYFMKNGSIHLQYAYASTKEDANWNVVLDNQGNPVMEYKVNGVITSYDDYSKYMVKHDGTFFEQIVAADGQTTYMDYYSASDMLNKLK